MSRALLLWFQNHKRALPWREKYSPYGVWIAELMLQQTQMERGVDYWLRWMKRFPDISAVAHATEEAILHAWEGLGYYRRARFIHSAAKAMRDHHHGRIPEDPDALNSLPGLGAYTVAAIRSIAFEHDVVAVDANVDRVFSRLLNINIPPKKKEAARRILAAAEALLPSGKARDYNQALMELGALVCKKVPLCSSCPLAAHCESRKLGLEKERPVQEDKATVIPVLAAFGVLMDQGRALLRKRPDNGLWAGLWEFPGIDELNNDSVEQALQRSFAESGLQVEIKEELGTIRHSYTNHRLSAKFFRVEARDPLPTPNTTGELPGIPGIRLVIWTELKNLAMPAHHRKMVERIV